MEQPASPKVGGHWSPYFVSSDTQETRAIVGRNIIAHRLEHKSRRKRPVTACFRTAALGRCTFHDMAYSMFDDGEAAIHVPNMANIFLFEMNLAGEMAVGQATPSRPFRPGEIYMINANASHAKLWRTSGRQLMIKIHQSDMEAALEQLIQMPVREPLRFEPVPQAASGTAGTLCKMIELMVGDFEMERPALAGSMGAGAEQMILELMLHAIPNNYSSLLANPAPKLRPRHVRRAAEYIHAHADRAIALNDLVRASGVSERTLHAGFQKYYGVSPMTYLRNVRLDRARLRLTQPGAGKVSVTAVALECGFGHLGKFARAYRDRFGELPSETLRSP